MMGTINVMKKYEKVQPYIKEVTDRNLIQKVEKSAKAERGVQYLIYDDITTTLDEMARVAEAIVQRSSTSSFTSGLMEPLKGKTIQMFCHF